MKTLSFLPENFSAIIHHLERGLPTILPTETCYGFSGDIFSLRVINRVEEIKGRQKKPFLLLVENIQHMSEYGVTADQNESIIQLSHERPTSFLLPKSPKIPTHYFPQFPEIGIRICSYKPLQGFLHTYKKPIFSTSANLSGSPEIYDPQYIKKYFHHIPDLLFVNAGVLPKNTPSRIIRILEDNTFEVIRK